jgi:hypothetical protein
MKTSEIPDFPRIKINNYISKLSNKIKVIVSGDSVSRFMTYDKIKIMYSKLDYTERTIKKYVQNNQYPFLFIKTLNDIVSKNIFYMIEQNNPIFFSKWKKVKLPGYLTPKLAYFIGYLQGDGSIESNKKRINFTDESEDHLNNINKICFDLFGIKGISRSYMTLISKKPVYRLDIGSLVLNSYLHKIFEINRGVKKDLKIPKIITQNKNILKWYLVGLFDADGTLPKNPKTCKQMFVDITFKDKGFIEEIQNQLKSFNIITLNPYCRIAKSPTSDYISRTWELRIRRKVEIIKFLNTIGFIHSDKGKRVKKCLNHMHP